MLASIALPVSEGYLGVHVRGQWQLVWVASCWGRGPRKATGGAGSALGKVDDGTWVGLPAAVVEGGEGCQRAGGRDGSPHGVEHGRELGLGHGLVVPAVKLDTDWSSSIILKLIMFKVRGPEIACN